MGPITKFHISLIFLNIVSCLIGQYLINITFKDVEFLDLFVPITIVNYIIVLINYVSIMYFGWNGISDENALSFSIFGTFFICYLFLNYNVELTWLTVIIDLIGNLIINHIFELI